MNKQEKKKYSAADFLFLVPGLPRELTLSLSPSNPSEEIFVEWRRPAGGDAITRYYLQLKLPIFSTLKYINHNSGQVNYSVTIFNLEPATAYNVSIAATNSAGWRSYTAVKTITTGRKNVLVVLLLYKFKKNNWQENVFADTVTVA